MRQTQQKGNMIKKLLTTILVAGLIGSVAAQNEKPVNLINCENPAEWTGKILLNKKNKRSGILKTIAGLFARGKNISKIGIMQSKC